MPAQVDSDRNCRRHHQKDWSNKNVNGVQVKVCEYPGCRRVWGGSFKLVRIY